MVLRNALMAAALAAGGLVLGSCSHEHAGLEPGFGLFFNDQGPTVSLAYGKANSDDVALMLQCKKGSGQVDVSDVARGGSAPRLILASSGRRTELQTHLQSGESDAPRLLVARAGVSADALKGFRHSGRIEVSYGAVRYGLKASRDERAGVERFFSACDQS